MLTKRISKVTVTLALLAVLAAFAIQAVMATSTSVPDVSADPWCYQTGEHYQLCFRGR